MHREAPATGPVQPAFQKAMLETKRKTKSLPVGAMTGACALSSTTALCSRVAVSNKTLHWPMGVQPSRVAILSKLRVGKGGAEVLQLQQGQKAAAVAAVYTTGSKFCETALCWEKCNKGNEEPAAAAGPQSEPRALEDLRLRALGRWNSCSHRAGRASAAGICSPQHSWHLYVRLLPVDIDPLVIVGSVKILRVHGQLSKQF